MKILCALSRYAYGNSARGENYDFVNFLPAFRELGCEVEFFDTGDRSHYSDFADLNLALLARVIEFQPDIIFCVLMHYEIWFETLDEIRANSPALIVNWGTDDSWKFNQASRFFAKHVDLHVTTDATAAENARSTGLTNVMLSQWAGSESSLAEPKLSSECQYDVTFIGSMYGARTKWISGLRAAGVAVSCFGHGTENGVVKAEDIPHIVRNSKISLNFSGSGGHILKSRQAINRQIKARTFEVPCAGGFLLTEAAPGLDRYFDPHREIAVFEDLPQLIERARHFLDHPDARDQLAKAGHARASTEHTYFSRFSTILAQLEQISLERTTRTWRLSAAALDASVEQHRDVTSTSWIRVLLLGLLTPVFGGVRGPRAARRLLYEMSWRLSGETTYRASGLAGRLFYAES